MGRVPITRLRLNDHERVVEREWMLRLGEYPEANRIGRLRGRAPRSANDVRRIGPIPNPKARPRPTSDPVRLPLAFARVSILAKVRADFSSQRSRSSTRTRSQKSSRFGSVSSGLPPCPLCRRSAFGRGFTRGGGVVLVSPGPLCTRNDATIDSTRQAFSRSRQWLSSSLCFSP
jgi:hypothetical protein